MEVSLIFVPRTLFVLRSELYDFVMEHILCQMEAIVIIVLKIHFATHAVLKIGEYHLDIPYF